MIVIVCLDDKKGMMYNHRRLSRDKAVTERIQNVCKGRKLWMNSYSNNLYGSLDGIDVIAEDEFLSLAGSGEYCLVESESMDSYREKIERIIIFWWNRIYPADVVFDLDLTLWERKERHEFQGFSHEKITEEIYERRT